MSISKPAIIAAVVFLVAVVASPAEGCPGYASPLSRCVFYFEGYRNQIPTFTLSPGGGDKLVAPNKLRYRVKGPDGKTLDEYVEVDNTGRHKYIPLRKNQPLSKNLKQDQFVFYGYPGATLSQRTYNFPTKFSDYKKLCIVLSLPSTQTKVKGRTVNLNRNDRNSLFPEDKRCVVFQTK